MPGAIADSVHMANTFARAGVLRPSRPDRALRALLGLHRWGPTLAAGYLGSAARYPEAPALIDELGTVSFAQVERRSNALARGMAGYGVRAGDRVAIMCRNHRYFVEASIACSKLGAHSVYLNTAFAPPQVADVVGREDPAAIVYDQEFGPGVNATSENRRGFVGWCDDPSAAVHPVLEELIASRSPEPLQPPEQPGRAVILTSGTTGTPKGANRANPSSLSPAAALLSAIPLRARENTMIAAPLFHSWGFAHMVLGTALASTLVLQRRFDPGATLQAIAEHRATALIVVPVMLQRILELSPERLRGYDTSSLRVIAVSGSALPGPLAQRVMDAFGDTLYNLYGSTEVAWATIASPADLRAAPGTAGRPPRGTVVKILGDGDRELAPGETGRIFVGSEMLFEGYTGGGDKARVGSLMATGDVGHFDPDGRLFVDGRDDDMIVSGGENVFPSEVEDLLAGAPGVSEAAVIGVADPEFGQRMRAFVVAAAGASLTEDGLKAYVHDNLARYKVPREIVFVDRLPRNATGKVLKRELS
ncbi:MAG TPA: AMP-binding protein [Solirubrobacteraceae bacterium]|jgi:fatty-acyl-CoA synthase